MSCVQQLSNSYLIHHTSIIVSIPVDVTGDEELLKGESEFKGEKGRYVAVERVIELENGNIEWK